MVEEEKRYFLSHEFWMDVRRKKIKRKRRGEKITSMFGSSL